jgi:hypothetical protein
MVTVTEFNARTGFEEPPTTDIYPRLQEIVEAVEPSLRGKVHVDEFRRAFIALGYMFRTAAPRSDLYFSSHVEAVNAILTRWGAGSTTGEAVFAALRAHGDIPWRRPDRSVGQLLEAGLNPHSGIKCSNRWKEILNGAPLLAPVAPDRGIARQDGIRVVKSASEM